MKETKKVKLQQKLNVSCDALIQVVRECNSGVCEVSESDRNQIVNLSSQLIASTLSTGNRDAVIENFTHWIRSRKLNTLSSKKMTPVFPLTLEPCWVSLINQGTYMSEHVLRVRLAICLVLLFHPFDHGCASVSQHVCQVLRYLHHHVCPSARWSISASQVESILLTMPTPAKAAAAVTKSPSKSECQSDRDLAALEDPSS